MQLKSYVCGLAFLVACGPAPRGDGYLFDWSIQFDPSLLTSCSGPIIE